MAISVSTRILSGTTFDKIGTKKTDYKTDTQVSASHVTF